MLSATDRRRAAGALRRAELAAEPIPPVRQTYPGLDIDDAYQIQGITITERVADGVAVIGHKVGLTSQPMQKQLGVTEPDYGHLLSDMVVPDGGTIDAATLCAPRIEPELAFVLGEDLRGPGVTVAHVLVATRYVLPALEVIDSRIADWSLTLPDTIADNASSARVVLGGRGVRVDAMDPRLVGVVLYRNGEVTETGACGAVLGNPAAAVCWLANTLARFGQGLAAGEVVMPGSPTPSIPVSAGDFVRADFDGIGHVSVRFEGGGIG